MTAVVAPLLVAAALAVPAARPAARRLAPWAPLPAVLLPLFAAGTVDVPWLLLGARLGLDEIGRALLPPTAFLWLCAGLAVPHFVGPERRDGFLVCFLVAMSGNFLLLAALEAVTFYLGFALMSFASYGLVVQAGTARARHAGRYYIVMVVLGEVCVITGLMLLASRSAIDFAAMRASFAGGAPGANNLVLGLLLAGFGIKAGVAGLHFWLPLAHPVAPAPASAVLSGAMIKAGLVAWLRFFPVGELALPSWGLALAALGLGTACYGVLAGLPQREPKTVLAYSSVSQMGLMTLGVGIGLAWPERWPLVQAALLVYIVHHGLLKGSLFLGAGIAHEPLSPGAARLLAAGFVLAAVSMAGGPWSGGLVAKLGLKHGLPATGAWHDVVPPLLVLSSLLTALLLLRFLWVAWPRTAGGRDSPPARLLAGWAVLLATALVLPWWLAAAGTRAGAVGPWAALEAAWPLLAALLLALGVLRLPTLRRVASRIEVPPGDLGIALEQGLRALGRRLDRGLDRVRQHGSVYRQAGRLAALVPAAATVLGRVEGRLSAWSMTGLLLLVVAISAAWLLG
ncbi:complex I subunit 5 family protein [Thioalkalivibrio sp. XN8]|uniref:complex I subunit 5 family protein n=1 Tax=Thioalkalivibrio sp. XN8 TaxID=2712863 RepID=UPI0013EC4C51|nr:complex I subunit 5 family protein [Thioalkalivibrio sp. XN8]NGP52697.1 hypothetical protein [Thioalkalivibrio sp. XN8]